MFNRSRRLPKQAEAAEVDSLSLSGSRKEELTTEEPYKKPNICLIDIDKNVCQHLTKRNFRCTEGTLGSLVKIEHKQLNIPKLCNLNHSFPKNLHEYDIVIVDLNNIKQTIYDEKMHQPSEITSIDNLVLQCWYPVNVFNPRPMAADLLRCSIQPTKEQRILLVFAGQTEYYEYIFSTCNKLFIKGNSHKLHIYDMLPSTVNAENLYGKELLVVPNIADELRFLLEKHLYGTQYKIVFRQPTKWKDGKDVDDDLFQPLLLNAQNKIAAFADFRNELITFVFPIIRDKAVFLQGLLEDVFPLLLPEMFPYCTRFSWLYDGSYPVPNEADLKDKRMDLQAEVEAKITEIDRQIEDNAQNFWFLRDLLSKTGEELVRAVEHFLRWLGFEDVLNVDETKPALLEEDLRVKAEDDMLVIEIKGLGSTSTDGDCSQVSKFRNRRIREFGKTDIHAIYIVNHQRYLPPRSRKNPPFSEHQINDAKADTRGLLTTYDLYKLYDLIESGIITKQSARRSLFESGLIKFQPNAKPLGLPIERLDHGGIIIMNLDDTSIKVGDKIVYEDVGGDIRITSIINIQINGVDVSEADQGEVGIKLELRIPEKVEIALLQP